MTDREPIPGNEIVVGARYCYAPNWKDRNLLNPGTVLDTYNEATGQCRLGGKWWISATDLLAMYRLVRTKH